MREKPFTLTTRIGDRHLSTERLADPFIESVTYVSRWDLIKAWFRGGLRVRYSISADWDMTKAVFDAQRALPAEMVQTVIGEAAECPTGSTG